MTPGGNIGGPEDAVHAECTGQGMRAVYGEAASAVGLGVSGTNGANKTAGLLGGLYGVEAVAANDGRALAVAGQAAFTRSGVLTVPAHKSSVKHDGIALTDGCFVLATLQQFRSGVYVAAAVPDIAADSLTIYLNKKVSAATKVAWFLLDKIVSD